MAAATSVGEEKQFESSTPMLKQEDVLCNANFEIPEEGVVHKESLERPREERWPVLLVERDPILKRRRSSSKTSGRRKISVDGEWLCLREITDVQFDVPHSEMITDDRDPVVIERTNLLGVCKLVTKELIESSLKYGRMLDTDHVPLQHFFIVLEHVLRHGLKPKKGLLGPKKELWNVLEMIEKYMPEAQDITSSVRDLPTVRSHLGRARAWIRLALMQKRLADYFKCLIDRKEDLLSEFYEPFALLMSDEAIVIGGLLVGLNVIDCNLCVKEEDLDSQQGVIDFSLYLRDNNSSSQPQYQEGGGGGVGEKETPTNMTAVLDQKNYLEELNRHLNATVTNLQAKVENLQTTNALMKEDLAISKNHGLALQEENDRLKYDQQNLQQEHSRKLEDARADMTAERETYQTSRAGLDHMYHEAKKKLQEETQMRMEVEKELELQISMKSEMEMATKLLEKDIHEKQDTIISLRQQLDDIKIINLEMYKKLQVCEASLKHKTELVAKLELKMAQMSDVIKQLEEKINVLEREHQNSEETTRKLGQQLVDREQKGSALETDLKIEREWRTSLQDNLVQDRERISQMLMELQQLRTLTKEYDGLKSKHEKLQRTCTEHEETLQDLAAHLGESKLKMEDMKEASRVLKEAVWTSDKDALTCKQCAKEFSIARRKHHCRHCGDIFCHSCSDNTMPLPSSAKPVRVCDTCHTLLLQRYSTA